MSDDIGGGTAPVVYPEGADPRMVRNTEMVRTVLDCSGTAWARDGALLGSGTAASGTCHGMPFAHGAPAIGDCVPWVYTELEGGGWKRLKPSDPEAQFSAYDISEDFLLKLAGGRRYRVHLRHTGQPIPHSYLNWDLRGRAEARAVEPATPAPSQATPAAPPSEQVDATLRLGASPEQALLGSAVEAIKDPAARFALGMMFWTMNRETERTASVMTFANNMAAQFTRGALQAGGGGSGVVELLQAQQRDLAVRLEAAERSHREAQSSLMEHRLREAASAAGGGGVSPLAGAMVELVKGVASTAVKSAIETAGPEKIGEVLSTAAGAVGAVAAAAG